MPRLVAIARGRIEWLGVAVATAALGAVASLAAGSTHPPLPATRGAVAPSAWTSPENLYVVRPPEGRVTVSLATHAAAQLSAVLGHLPAARPAYGWPVRPFDRQHPVRGNLNDPRIGTHGGRAFHFGVDIAAPDGTPVYAVQGGVAHVHRGNVAVVAGAHHGFGYWHIRSAVRNLQHVHARQLVGWILPGWGHVHLAERLNGRYLNPLRPGGMGPYVDHSVPRIAALALVPTRPGVFALAASAYDMPWPSVPGPWRNEPVTPSLVQWRIMHGDRAGPWRTAVDFRSRMLPRSLYSSIYAPPTLESRRRLPGRYWFYLAHAWHPPSGRYRVEVAASDARGNRVVVAANLAIAGGEPL